MEILMDEARFLFTRSFGKLAADLLLRMNEMPDVPLGAPQALDDNFVGLT